MDATERARHLAWRITAAFAAAATAWILFSDVIIDVLGVELAGWADPVKGLAFIVVISVLLYATLVRLYRSELALADQEVRQSELEAQLFQRSPEAMWVYDPATLEILAVNDTMAAAFGRSRAELLALGAHELGPDQDGMRRRIAELTGRGQPSTWLFHGPAGTQRWVEVTSHPIEREGRLVRLALGRDVTEQRQAEAALRASERRLASVLSTMQEVAFSIDLVERRIVYLNEVAAELFGSRRIETLRTLDDLTALILPEDRHLLTTAAEDVITRGWAEVEVRLQLSPDAMPRTLRLRGRAVRSESGEVDQIDGIAIDLTHRQELERLVAHHVAFDQLTGLSVRTAFLTAVDASLAAASGSPPAVLAMFDLDRFAAVNEAAGHEAGDVVLVTVADRMSSVLEPGMLAARVGGDEFAVFCPAGLADAADLGPRLRAAVEGPMRIGSLELYVSMSVGLATAGAGRNAEELIRDAHLAMSAAKERTSGIEMFDPSRRAVAIDRVRIESELRRALREGELRPAFQPQIDLRSGRLVGVEALIRWDHPQRGVVAAGEFIGEAERSNLIIDIGDFMLEASLAQAAEWHRRHGDLAPVVWINLSRRELDDGDVVDRVLSAIEFSGAPFGCVGIEVTETAFVAEGGAGLASLNRLAEAGVALALDDFGTGWSSLKSLKSFPLSAVKIDASFVRNVAVDGDDRQIVSAIVGMAKGMSLATLAEGVETPEQLAALVALGCEGAQGYLLGRPGPAEVVDRAIAAGAVDLSTTSLWPRTG